jgi:hypothetical protein
MANALTDDERRELARLLAEGARLVLEKRRVEQRPEAPQPASAPANSRNEPT